MRDFIRDARLGIRSMARRPGFTLLALVTLALGVGANTAIFSVVDAVLLEPLPYRTADRLVSIRTNQSLPEMLDIRERTTAFDAMGGIVRGQPLDLESGPEPVQIQAGMLAGRYFEVFGVRPAAGRLLDESDDVIGGPRVAVLTHGLWEREFGADPGVVGRTVVLSGMPYTVVGVTERGFRPPLEEPDVYTPVSVSQPNAAPERGVHFLRFYATLAPGATIERAQAELDAVNAWMETAFPEESSNRVRSENQRLVPLQERVVSGSRDPLLVLFAAVGLVLLIACANFANLLLTRAVSRQGELAVRVALGAGRGRIAAQLVAETLVLALVGGALGVLFAGWLLELLIALEPGGIPRIDEVGLDPTVLAFAFGVSALTGVLFGALPAYASLSFDVGEALKAGDRRTGTPRTRLHGALVVAETAVALVLLVGAGLLIRTIWHLYAVEPGYDPSGVTTMRIELPQGRYEEKEQQQAFRSRFLEELNATPGMRAALISEVPLGGDALDHDAAIEGAAPVAPGQEPSLYSRSVAGDYFATMGIPVVAGRVFGPGDRAGAPLVAVANEAMVRTHLQGRDPVGARFRWARQDGEPQWIEIVGVVRDVRHFGLGLGDQPAVYTPYDQAAMSWKRWQWVVVRGAPDAAPAAIRSALRSVDPQLPMTRVRTLEEVLDASLSFERFLMSLLLAFAGLALALAAVGTYGVVSFAVATRTREFGVRVAVGASGRDIVALVLRRGAALAGLGLAIGLAAAYALSRYVESLLFGVTARDPYTFVAGAALLFAVALLACLVPALRASRVDPLEALRCD